MKRAERAARRATQREAFERRCWRLALLLTGNDDDASRTLDAVARTARDLAHVDAVRLDRLTVLHAREVVARKRRTPPSDEIRPPDGPGADALRALGAMKPQAREAWVLARVDELDPVHVARAMDASRTASGHFLEAAEAHLREQLGDRLDEGARRLAAWAADFDPDPWLILHREHIRRRRKTKLIAAGVGAGVVIVAVLLAAASL